VETNQIDKNLDSHYIFTELLTVARTTEAAPIWLDPIVFLCCIPVIVAIVLFFIPSDQYGRIRSVVMSGSVIACFWSQYTLVQGSNIIGSTNFRIYS
jgi:hypothetical protein